jgi:uncharacterized membrane protein YdjX (TVP38/TMEM64 family)
MNCKRGATRRGTSFATRSSGDLPMTAPTRKEYLWLIVVGGVLLSAVLLVHAHADSIRDFIDQQPAWGLLLYVLLNILDALIAPGATLPLIPVASRVWGPILTAFVTTAGWTSGSLIAFLVARRWGAPMVEKMTSMRRVREMKRYIPEDLFWSIVLVRLVLPMDIISYVLGLFTKMGWARYAGATAIGLAPPAFLLAFLGKLPHAYEIIAFGIGGGIVVVSVLVARRKQSRAKPPSHSRHHRSHAGA